MKFEQGKRNPFESVSCRSLRTMSDNGDPEKKGGVWDLDKQLDQPMDEEAKTVRNVCGDQVLSLSLSLKPRNVKAQVFNLYKLLR